MAACRTRTTGGRSGGPPISTARTLSSLRGYGNCLRHSAIDGFANAIAGRMADEWNLVDVLGRAVAVRDVARPGAARAAEPAGPDQGPAAGYRPASRRTDSSRYFDTTAFVPNQTGQFGSAPRAEGQLQSPGNDRRDGGRTEAIPGNPGDRIKCSSGRSCSML